MTDSKRATSGCCRDETKMVRCAVTALQKMKDIFNTTLCTLEDSSLKPPTATSGCTMNTKCQTGECPFRGARVPNILQKLCAKGRKSGPENGRSALQLMPGEVGLRGDRATFHLGQSYGQPVPLTKDGRPSGATYYNVRPTQPPVSAMDVGRGVLHPKQRKHMMQILPALPASVDQAVGPVTGLPIAGEEHVFLVRLGKKYDGRDEKVRLQLEVRLPKQDGPIQTDISTQYLTSDVSTEKKKKVVKGKKGKKGKKSKKDKKGGKKKKGKK